MYKKYFIPLLLGAMTLVACSAQKQDDPFIPNPEEPTPTPNLESINFGGNSGNWMEAPASRVTNNTPNGLETLYKSFKVWAYKTTNDNATTKEISQTVMDGYIVNYMTHNTETDTSSPSGTAGSTSSNTADWEYVGITNPLITQSIKYWDYDAKDYRFFAYAPSETTPITITHQEETGTDGTANKYQSITLPFAYSENATAQDVPYGSELWYSAKDKADGTTNSASNKQYGKCVTLTFAPLAAKVRFKFTYPEGTDGITITNIQLRDSRFIGNEKAATTPVKGNIIVTYPQTGTPTSTHPAVAWQTATGTDATGSILLTIPYEEKSDPIHVVKDESDYNKWYFVPPFFAGSDSGGDTGSTGLGFEQGPYTITAKIDGNETSATVPAAYMQWKTGYQYTYIFKITPANTGITFSDMEVEQWLENTPMENGGNGTTGW